MNKRTIVFGLLLPAYLGLFGCTAQLSTNNQIKFGIQSANRDLWDEAIFRWRKAIALNPQSAAAHNNLAVALEKKGLWEEAGKLYEAALRLSPKNVYIQSNLDEFKARLESKEKEDAEKKK